MSFNGLDYNSTWLWNHAFIEPRNDATKSEQQYFMGQYLLVRERVTLLASRISIDSPGLTVHDISHLDALWETASLVSEGSISMNPAEAFVLGCSILMHDAALSLAAYPGGLKDIQETIEWKDAIAKLNLAKIENGDKSFNVRKPPKHVVSEVLPDVLRRLHAGRSAQLAEQAWVLSDNSQQFLIEESELRRFYGSTIGKISHSHWWPVQKIENEFQSDLGPLATRTQNVVDKVKIACILRIADALHLDSRRAPRFLRALSPQRGLSALHWSFQEKLAKPHVERDEVVFTSGQPFSVEEAESWWLAYDMIDSVDHELHDVFHLMQSRGRGSIRTRSVKGVESPESMSLFIQCRDWRPVNARFRATDIPLIIKNLGGSKLYGDDPTVALRELIQNASDAIQARRRLQERNDKWGDISVRIEPRDNEHWLVVEDNGVGMSEPVLTGPLLDFGTSFWKSNQVMEEFPGLLASGMQPIGRFGIGFFSIFMLGSHVKVFTKRFDRGNEQGRLLEFTNGSYSRPVLSTATGRTVPVDGGTRIEVRLEFNPNDPNGLLFVGRRERGAISLQELVGKLAPNVDVNVSVQHEGILKTVVAPGDWLALPDKALVARITPGRSLLDHYMRIDEGLMQNIVEADGNVVGRAYITDNFHALTPYSNLGCVTVSGLRACTTRNIVGILTGNAINAARDIALPVASLDAISRWASNQAKLIASNVYDDERQAQTAEVVLECQGSIGNLKFLRWGVRWITQDEFRIRLKKVNEIAVYFQGDFEFDEEADDVRPRDFRDYFAPNNNIIVALQHDGNIVNNGNIEWPRSLADHLSSGKSKVEDLARKLIYDEWGDETSESEQYRFVGTVEDEAISRVVTVFRRMKV